MPAPSGSPRTARRADLVVVGAGPAGCAAALTGARAGLDVVLVDKSRFPRDKCCGDGLTTGALRRLESLGLSPRDVASFHAVDDLFIRSPSGRILTVPLATPRAPGVRAAVARRIDLDAALLTLARRAGATVLEGSAAVRLEPVRGQGACGALQVGLEGGEALEAGIVVAADGAWSPLRRLAGALEKGSPAAARTGGRREWHAFRTYARDVAELAAGHLWVAFPPAVLPGYLWSFPLSDGRANVGLCLERTAGRKGADLRAAWHEALTSPFLSALLGRRAVLEAPGRSWPIPAGVFDAPLSACGGRVLFAGDAARGADPFTGEGVGQALEMGIAAGRAVATHVGSPPAAAAAYASEIARTLRIDHRIALAARALFSRPLGARAALFGTGLSPGIGRRVGRFLYEDHPRALVVTPWRWRPGLTAAPAPFSGDAPRA